jgi:hypothetical protein
MTKTEINAETKEESTREIKHAGGRPPTFNTPEELQKMVDEYFDLYSGLTIMRDSKGEAVVDKQGKPILEIKPPTVSGLAYHVGFLSRNSVYDYAKRDDEFSCIFKRAKLRIVDFSERMLYSGKPVGAIFALKNSKEGFEDAVKVNSEVKQAQFDVSKLSNDDLVQLSNMMKRISKSVVEESNPVTVNKN